MATFLEKLLSNPDWKILIPIAIAAFVLCIMSSVILFAGAISFIDLGPDNAISRSEDNVVYGAAAASWLGFSVGMICLAVFTIRNLWPA